jgi:hypothetical protein
MTVVAAGRDDPAHPEHAYRERARLVAVLAAAHEARWAEPDPADPHAAAYPPEEHETRGETRMPPAAGTSGDRTNRSRLTHPREPR